MTVNPQNDISNYIDQWNQANTQYSNDYGYLMQMLTQMIALAKSGNVGEAFQMAEMDVMPGAMQTQGDTMGQLASGMNIASALQEFSTNAQNFTNDPESGAKFAAYLKQVYADIQDELMLPKDKQYMSSSTANGILNSINQICNTLGFTGPNDPNFTDSAAAAAITNWESNPTTTFPNGKTGQQNLQDMQSSFTQWNNTESAQSQGLQAQEQFASNTFNQYLNACTDVFQSSQQQAQNMVQNQKSQ